MRTRFFTISDARFFVGTVALLNSLRLLGHRDELVVLDLGFTEEQRRRLAPECSFLSPPAGVDPYLAKPFPALVEPGGLIVLIDSDIVLTQPLEPVLERARAGKICVYPDHWSDLDRRFDEWQELFRLDAPLRRREYMNAGFVAVSSDVWPGFFQRWWDACALIPTIPDEVRGSEPVAQRDQDALNALLMSEISESAIEQLPGYEWDLARIAVTDAQRLRCRAGSEEQPLLHTPLSPKRWQPGGWRRVRRDAYMTVAPRLLLAHDVALRLEPDELPVWLRRGLIPRLVVVALDAFNRVAAYAARLRRAPRKLSREARRLLGRVRWIVRRGPDARRRSSR